MSQSPWPGPIAAITLFVEDLAAAKRFYESAFGLPLKFEDANSAVFEFPNTLINLLSTTAVPELIAPATMGSGPRCVFTIGVDDVDAMCSRLADLGVELLNGPMDRPWASGPPASATPAATSGRSPGSRCRRPRDSRSGEDLAVASEGAVGVAAADRR